MDALGYFVTGIVRPLILLVFWVPLIAAILWLVRRFAPQHERWLFYRITARGLVLAVRRAMRRRVRASYIASGKRRY